MGRFANIDTRDPAVNVTTWFLVVVAALSVLIRLGTKFWLFGKLTSDDFIIIAALVLCIAQSAAVSAAVAHGYGDHFSTVSTGEFGLVMKYQYAASLLYIASLCLSKLSLCTFIRNLTPVHRDHFRAAILQAGILALGLTGIFGTAFQCDLPRPWDYWEGGCFDLRAWTYFLSAANIATDIAIIVQALLLIFGIQATWKKKAVFASVFLSRVFVIIPLIAEIVLFHTYSYPDSADSTPAPALDPTYTPCPAQIATQIVQSLSILTACWGQVKPFLNQLKSNGLRIRGVEYQGSSANSKQAHPYAGHGNGNARERYELVPVTAGQTETTVESAGSGSRLRSRSRSQGGMDLDIDGDGELDVDIDIDGRSYSSQTGIIRETRTWAVRDGR